MNIYWMRIKNI